MPSPAVGRTAVARTAVARTAVARTAVARTAVGLIALPLSLVLVAGCSSAADSGAATDPAGVGQVADRGAAGSDESAVGGLPGEVPSDGSVPEGGLPIGDVPGSVPANAPPGSTTPTEQIVRTGDVSVDVDNITSSANRITALVEAAGGSVGSDQRFGDATDGNADLVVRTPPDSFEALIETVSGLGEELSRTVSSEDVSTVVADVDARVRSLQNSVDRLLTLASQAVSVSDLLAIESELSSRQGELESLQAQQRALADQVSLATLSVRLIASSEPDNEDTGFLASLGDGWKALLAAGGGLISIVGLLLPWLIVVLVIAVPLWFIIRRRRPSAPRDHGSVPEFETVSAPAANGPDRPPA